ncbi:MAG: NAD-dependent epimerase [Phycisphaerales bacterium]
MTTLVTGAAGFIGSAVAQRLLEQGERVVGLDNLNDYYDPALKRARLARLEGRPGFEFVRMDLADRAAIAGLFQRHGFERVAHLGAQAGVRYAAENPGTYADANLVGTANILEGCRHAKVAHLVYASTSSVYGANPKLPFEPTDAADHPVSFYAATKRANELMAHSYSHLFGLPTTGLRFFTVYGPWGRPDMALFKFTRLMLLGKPIPVFNGGHHRRDFTYIDDVVEAVVRVLRAPPRAHADAALLTRADASPAPWRLYNVGCSRPVELMDYIRELERSLGVTAQLEMLPPQPGDVPDTFADVASLERDFGFRPQVGVAEGVRRFVEWYVGYYGRTGEGAPA